MYIFLAGLTPVLEADSIHLLPMFLTPTRFIFWTPICLLSHYSPCAERDSVYLNVYDLGSEGVTICGMLGNVRDMGNWGQFYETDGSPTHSLERWR